MDKDFSNELMDYLYNEMSSEERKQFELQIEADPELKQEFEDLKTLRSALGEIKDKEVVEPVSIAGPAGSHSRANSVFGNFLRPLISVAASISLVLLIGYLTHFSVRYDRNGFYMGFSDHPVESSISEDQAIALIKSEIAKSNEHILRTVEDQSAQFGAQLTNLQMDHKAAENIRSEQPEWIPREQVKAYIEATQENNIALLKEYLKLYKEQQLAYFQGMLHQFSDFVQDQREEDLVLIQRSLVNLKQNQELQKQETDHMLANLLTNASPRNN